jgi:hypothetical protein
VSIGTLRFRTDRKVTRESTQVPRAPTAFALRVQQAPEKAPEPTVEQAVGHPAHAEPPSLRKAGKSPSREVKAWTVPPGDAGPPPLAPAPAAPAPPPPPPPHDPEAEARADAAFDAVSLDLDLDHASYRATWDQLRSRLDGLLSSVDDAARRALIRRLQGRYDTLGQEPQWRALAGIPEPAAVASDPPHGPAVGAPAVARPVTPAAVQHPSIILPAMVGPAASGAEGQALQLLRVFGESYLPEQVDLGDAASIEAVLGRVSAVLEGFGKAYLELRGGYEEFGKEMGVRTIQAEGSLARARDARSILAYVLDPRAPGREVELQRAFADFMIHQMALLRGVVTGGQALLDQVSPEAISAEATGVWPLRAANMWKAFEERFHELRDDENGVSEVLFGREFCRAYAGIVGGGGPGEDDDEPDDEEDGR